MPTACSLSSAHEEWIRLISRFRRYAALIHNSKSTLTIVSMVRVRAWTYACLKFKTPDLFEVDIS